jgi:hypothetical protein
MTRKECLYMFSTDATYVSIFDPQLTDSTDEEPTGTVGQLYLILCLILFLLTSTFISVDTMCRQIWKAGSAGLEGCLASGVKEGQRPTRAGHHCPCVMTAKEA